MTYFLLNTFVFAVTFLLPLLILASLIYLLISLLRRLTNKLYKFKKLHIVAGIILVLVPLLYLGIFFLIGRLMCGEYELQPVASPNGIYSAQVKEYDCGAITGFNSWVELRNEQDKKKSVFSYASSPNDIELEWLDDNELKISYTNTYCPTRRLRKEKMSYPPGDVIWEDIVITYEDICTNE